MSTTPPRKQQCQLRYPKVSAVVRGCESIALYTPADLYLTVVGKLHNLSLRDESALLQVFKVATLAGGWMLRDIGQRKPLLQFAKYRKRNSTSYLTKAIADDIRATYRSTIRSRYTLNANVFDGMCSSLANNVSGYLQRMSEAAKKGQLQRYHECAEFVVEFGKHKGKKLGSLGRRSIFGYAFLQPKLAQCEEALTFINVLLNDLPEEQSLASKAEQYKLPFGPRRGRPLGSMRSETLRRLKALVERDRDRMDAYERVRVIAQDYLRFTPPGFPSIDSDGLSEERQRTINTTYSNALDAFAALPPLFEPEEEIAGLLAEHEHQFFIALQRAAYAAAARPKYRPLQWNRADGCVRGREIAVVYEPKTGKYLFLAHLLAAKSRYRQPLRVKGDLYDVNNPNVKLASRDKPNVAMLFELEFSSHQQKLLDRARADMLLWKEKGESSGAIRSATLQAYEDTHRQRWWFEVQLSVGFKPSHYIQPERVVGVHVDVRDSVFVTILELDGTLHDFFHLDEKRIAHLLNNKQLDQQAHIDPAKRTAKERSHRIADALAAICVQYRAQLGVENIGYRKATLAQVRLWHSRTTRALSSHILATSFLCCVYR